MNYTQSGTFTKTDKVTVHVIAKDKQTFDKVVESYGNEEDMYKEIINNYEGYTGSHTLLKDGDSPEHEIRFDYHKGYDEWDQASFTREDVSQKS
jgi:molybdopterin converting factor small subunit